MKKIFWYCSGFFKDDNKNEKILDAFMAGGCSAVEWTIPVENPYREQDHLKPFVNKAYQQHPSMSEHLDMMAKFRKKYPDAEIFPALYQESIYKIGLEPLVKFCKDNKIDTIFEIGTVDSYLTEYLMKNGLKITTTVSYYMTDEELEKVRKNDGFIYMQALPYQKELDAGYTTARLKEVIEHLRKIAPGRPIYCAKGIKKPEHVKIVEESGGDGFILGSFTFDYYDKLDELVEIVKQF